jgi:tetratricopeptide (TPR) repeat protein
MAGEYVAALHLLTEGVRIAREHTLLMPLLNGLFVSGITLTDKGDYDEACALFEEGLALSEKVGDVVWGNRLLNGFGWLCLECGELDRALDLNRRSAEGARRRNEPEVFANAEVNLGDTLLARGEIALAQECFDGVSRVVSDPATSDWNRWRYSMHLFASLGELWLVRGNDAKVQEYVDQCLEIATRTNSRKYIVIGWRLKGQIACARRQWDEADGWLQQALPLAQTVGNPTQLWKTHLALGQLHTAMKRPERAQQAYHEAREVIDHLKENLRHPELRASLESSSLIQQIYDLSASG